MKNVVLTLVLGVCLVGTSANAFYDAFSYADDSKLASGMLSAGGNPWGALGFGSNDPGARVYSGIARGGYSGEYYVRNGYAPTGGADLGNGQHTVFDGLGWAAGKLFAVDWRAKVYGSNSYVAVGIGHTWDYYKLWQWKVEVGGGHGQGAGSPTEIAQNQWVDYRVVLDPAGDGGKWTYALYYGDGSGGWIPDAIYHGSLGLTGDWQGFGNWDSVGIYLQSTEAYTYGELDSLSISVIPEPATMALLGFGGLLLRRKK